MAAITRVTTISVAAKRLGVDIELLEELVITMDPEDGVLWIIDDTEHGCQGFTDFGLENAAEQLSDPEIVRHLRKLIANNRR